MRDEQEKSEAPPTNAVGRAPRIVRARVQGARPMAAKEANQEPRPPYNMIRRCRDNVVPWRVGLEPSFVAQSDHGIDTHGPPRRRPRRGKHDTRQQHGCQ